MREINLFLEQIQLILSVVVLFLTGGSCQAPENLALSVVLDSSYTGSGTVTVQYDSVTEEAPMASTVPTGTSVTLTATADENYIFKQFTLSYPSGAASFTATVNPFIFTLTEDTVVSVGFDDSVGMPNLPK